MDNLKAARLIEQQRRRWRSQEPDQAIARRAERVYFALAAAWAIMGLGFVAAAAVSGKAAPFLFAGLGFCLSAPVLYWQSRRFTQIWKHLADSDARPNSP